MLLICHAGCAVGDGSRKGGDSLGYRREGVPATGIPELCDCIRKQFEAMGYVTIPDECANRRMRGVRPTSQSAALPSLGPVTFDSITATMVAPDADHPAMLRIEGESYSEEAMAFGAPRRSETVSSHQVKDDVWKLLYHCRVRDIRRLGFQGLLDRVLFPRAYWTQPLPPGQKR